NLSRQLAACDSSQKDSRYQQQSRPPGNIIGSGIRDHRQQSCWWNQRHQAGALSAMLAESQQQTQNRHQNHAAADPKHSRSDSCGDAGQQNPTIDQSLPVHAPPSFVAGVPTAVPAPGQPSSTTALPKKLRIRQTILSAIAWT